jgi:C4-dicarboxylate transporter DctM subunit
MSFLVIVLVLCLLFVAGFPVAFALGVAGAVGLLITDQSLRIVAEVIYSSVDSFVLLAIPLFVLMSRIMLKTGIGEDIFAMLNAFLRHLPGGLAIATVGSSTFFSTISGSSVTNAATVGIIAMPALTKHGYPKRFAAGLVAAGGTLGILIPPSIPLIIYGAITGESVSRLFIAGIIPGVIIAAMICAYAVLVSYLRGYGERQARASWVDRLMALRRGGVGLVLPLVILGGIYTGVFTPTEAAAIGVLAALLIAILLYRTLTPQAMLAALSETVHISVMVLAIVAGAKLFGHVTTTMQIPQIFADWINDINIGRGGFLAAVMLALILLGDFLDPVSIILIVVPILHPVLGTLGIDPIWFAVLLVINMELANITPPVGLNLFVIQGIQRDLSFAQVLIGTAPFMAVIGLGLIVMMAFPMLSLWLTQHVR